MRKERDERLRRGKGGGEAMARRRRSLGFAEVLAMAMEKLKHRNAEMKNPKKMMMKMEET